MILRRNPLPHWKWGYADFLNSREKELILNLAEAKPDDVLYDLGCGDGSFLIFAVEQFGIQRAVGYENMPQRIGKARKKVEEHGLGRKIEIRGKDLNKEADLNDADIVLDMLPQGSDDVERLYSGGIEDGAKIIKHDLPLIGYMPDKIDYPFYRHSIPLVKAESAGIWASTILNKRKSSLFDVWHELYYYESEKAYSKWDIKDFIKIASNRFHS